MLPMPLSRRTILGLFLGAALPAAAGATPLKGKSVPVNATTDELPDWTDDERLTISTMVERGKPNFIMMNEKQGWIKLIENGRLSYASRAASGDVKGDDPYKNPRVTPAGIFKLTDYKDNKHIEYFTLKDFAYLIHVTSPRRDMLLGTNNPEKFRASAGCIAVPRPVFDEIRRFMRQYPGTNLIVLPEVQDIRTTLGIDAVPAPK